MRRKPYTRYTPIEIPDSVAVPKPKIGAVPVNHTGKRFGRLVVLRYLGRRESKSNPRVGNSVWLCQCDCGNKIPIVASRFVSGHTVSCGCKSNEVLAAAPGANKKRFGESARNQHFSNYQKSARQRGHEFKLTFEEFCGLTQGCCYYCGWPPINMAPRAKGTYGNYYCNGIDRIDNNCGYLSGNVRSCCKTCNTAKSSLTEEQFYAWIRRLVSTGKHRGKIQQITPTLFEETVPACGGVA